MASILVASGVGLSIREGGLAAHVLLVVGFWSFGAALVIGRYRNERALTAAARAWPRLAAYRPARFVFETTKWRSPGPAALLAVATVVAVIGICTLTWREDKLPEWGLIVALVVSGVLLVAIAAAFWLLHRRARRLRRAYRNEGSLIMRTAKG